MGERIVAMTKLFASMIQAVGESLGAERGMLLVARGVRLQGNPGSPEALAAGAKNSIPGFRYVGQSGDAEVSAEVRKPGTWTDAEGVSHERSMNYPRLFVPAGRVAEIQPLANQYAVVDALCAFDTTYTKKILWVPATDPRVASGRAKPATSPDGTPIQPQICYPIEVSDYGYRATIQQVVAQDQKPAAAEPQF